MQGGRGTMHPIKAAEKVAEDSCHVTSRHLEAEPQADDVNDVDQFVTGHGA